MIEISQTRVRRRDRRWRWLALAVFVAVFLFVFLKQGSREEESEVQAASLANFDPGYIISDYQMGNYNSMNEAEIQAWLTSKNSCPNTNYDYYLQLSANTNYTWHWENGHFVCLSEELFGDGEVIGSGETAAHIIWQTAQDYHINPQVILVLLQKETGLITDPIPNNGDYRKATGYGCPDTAPCSSQYYGFKNQVRKAAALFRTVLDGGWTNYPLGDNYIQYNPSASCGGSVVNIRSLATSALYRYTPYQPNEGALAAGYGTAYCGAYGNRNFYLYFEDWFGGITMQESLSLGRTIPEGTYQITIGNEAIDIRGGIQDGMTNGELITYQAKSQDDKTLENQSFTVRYNNGYYNIYNEASGLYLTYSFDGASVNEYSNDCSQKWILKRKNNGIYEIITSCHSARLMRDGNGGLSFSGNSDESWKFFEISGRTNKLEDGDYQIVSKMSQGLVLEIEGDVDNSTQNGQIKTWARKDLNQNLGNQIFNIEYDEETGYYVILNKTSGLSLDVRGGNDDDGAEIIAWSSNQGCNQRWMIRLDDDGFYSIMSACTGKVLDARGGQPIYGKEILLWTDHGGNNQKWSFENINENAPIEGTYTINLKTEQNFVIDIAGGVTENMLSGEAIIYSNKGGDNNNQQFEVAYNKEEGYYTIQNPASGLFMNAEYDELNNQSRVFFAPYSPDSCAQRWRIVRSSLGFYNIWSVCTDAVVDVSGGIIQNNTGIILYKFHGGNNQKWVFYRVNN